jgi:hypothetical protein
MSEYNLDNLFDRFRRGGPLVIPAGADAARAAHHHRRRVRVVAAGVLTAALIAVPAMALAVDGGPRRVPPPPADRTVEPTPSLPAPAPSAPSTPRATSEPPPLSGRFSTEELGNATLEIPTWPDYAADTCPSGNVRFRDGRAALPGVVEHDVRIKEVIHVDVDRDGTDETAARFVCLGLAETDNKVLVFDRDRAGKVVTFGQVLTESGDIGGIIAIRKSGTSVEVRVVDYFDGVANDLMQFQWRAYSWNGDRFVQSGGPTAFPPNPKVTDLSVAGQDLRLTPVAADVLGGTLTVTIRNEGPHSAARPKVVVHLSAWLSVARPPAGCTSVRSASDLDLTCNLAELQVRADVDLVFAVKAPAWIGTGATYRAAVESSSASGGPRYPDAKPADNVIQRNAIIG